MKNNTETSARTWIVFSLLTIMSLAIITKVFIIQLGEGDKWTQTGERFDEQIRTITPTRGQILAEDGSLFATSVPEYSIYWDSKADGLRKNLDRFHEKLDSLSWCFANEFQDRSQADYKAIFKTALAQEQRYARIKTRIDYTQLQRVKKFPIVRLGRFKSGFVIDKKDVRKKPFGKLASRTIGIDRDGKRVGLERAYHVQLAGKEGSQLQEKIAGNIWKPISDNYITAPVDGVDLITTIDVHLQDIAENSLEDQLKKHNAKWGCVVLMEVETGYVRAIANLEIDPDASEPTYHETYNYAIGFTDEPGSTFKLASMMAALESGKIDLKTEVDMGNGKRKFFGSQIHDSNWDKGGHGTGTVEEVFEWSSNIGMAEITKQCFQNSKQEYLDYLHSFGAGQSLGISIKGEKEPIVYKNVGDGRWSGISHLWMSMGYEVAQSPIQTLAFYNAVANDGRLVRPLFASEFRKNGKSIEKVEPVVINNRICSNSTLAKCRKMMEGVCDEHGTAHRAFAKAPYEVAGKTGTAWLYENGSYNYGRYRASFVGYFPADDPKYSCIVVVHDPRGGSYYGSTVAAPVFKRLADHLHATQLYTPTPIQDDMLAKALMPISKNGHRSDLTEAFAALNIPTQSSTQASWISTTTKNDHVEFGEREIQSGVVPEVRGMGLQDALFLLENAGLKVKVTGHGAVDKQSLTAGQALRSGQTIEIELR